LEHLASFCLHRFDSPVFFDLQPNIVFMDIISILNCIALAILPVLCLFFGQSATNRRSPLKRALQIPAPLRKLFNMPTLMAGEDKADYDELLHLVCADVKPSTVHEWLLARDIADAEWELLRLRGLKPAMLHAALPRAFRGELSSVEDSLNSTMASTIRRLVIAMVAGDPEAKQELTKLLAERDMSLDFLTAVAFEQTIGPQLHADRMAGAAYDRRNKAYAELERLRERRGSAATEKIADDDLEEEVEGDLLAGAEAPSVAPDSSSTLAADGSPRA
jgi:hypothetical protein